MSSSEGYILNALQTPPPIQPIYDSLQAGNTTREAIMEDTGIEEGTFDQAFQGLQLLRLVGREEHEYYPADLTWETGDHRLDIRMTALHNLAAECTPNDWGKQAVVLLSYQYLLKEDIQYFENDDEGLYTAIDDWYRQEKRYDPQSSQGSIHLNKPKFVNWSRLLDYLGLIYKTTGREHAVYPDEAIVRESIRLAADDDEYVEIRDYLHWLQRNLIQVELTRDGSVPAPFARVLFNLVRDDHIRLVERGDAGAVGLSRVPSRDGIDPAANTIKRIS
jgi:hypothetical protein